MKRHGFTLMELLGLLVVMAAGMMLASALFVSANRALMSATRGQEMAGAYDSAVGLLRRDVWNAAGLALEDGQTLVVSPAGDGAKIRWHVDGEGALVREANSGAGDSRTWRRIGTGMSFEVAGSSVRVRVEAANHRDGHPDSRPAEVALASLVMAARTGGAK